MQLELKLNQELELKLNNFKKYKEKGFVVPFKFDLKGFLRPYKIEIQSAIDGSSMKTSWQ